MPISDGSVFQLPLNAVSSLLLLVSTFLLYSFCRLKDYRKQDNKYSFMEQQINIYINMLMTRKKISTNYLLTSISTNKIM